MNKNLFLLARQLKKKIGKHVYMIGNSKFTSDDYYQAKSESDAAVSLANYLIRSLENRAHAQDFAYQVGMPGYFHSYKG